MSPDGRGPRNAFSLAFFEKCAGPNALAEDFVRIDPTIGRYSSAVGSVGPVDLPPPLPLGRRVYHPCRLNNEP